MSIQADFIRKAALLVRIHDFRQCGQKVEIAVGRAVGARLPVWTQELFTRKRTRGYLTHSFQQLERQTADALRRKRSKFKSTGFTRDKSRNVFGLRGFSPTGRHYDDSNHPFAHRT